MRPLRSERESVARRPCTASACITAETRSARASSRTRAIDDEPEPERKTPRASAACAAGELPDGDGGGAGDTANFPARHDSNRLLLETISRWHRSGRVLPVWSWHPSLHAEPVDFLGTSDGNLGVEGQHSHRRQRLLWNPERFTFEVERPTYPIDQEDFRCNPSPHPPYVDRR